MMLAIVIPYYKKVFFEETLMSLAKQTDQRFKVYIGDDASTENPEKLLSNYKNQFDVIYHRFRENLGKKSLVQQWERCIELTENEEWIMILGDDDFLEETVIESWYKHYDAFIEKSNVIRFATKSVNMKLNKVSDLVVHPLWEKATDSYYRRFKGLTRSTLSEYIFSKEIFMKYRFHNFPLAWHSDDAAWLTFADNKPIYTINDSNVFIRYSAFSISGNKLDQGLKNLACEKFYSECIYKNITCFDKKQKTDLTLEYEKAIKKNRKLKTKEWLSLLRFYFLNTEFLLFLKCIRRFILSLFS
ncbi:glycosyltransferase family 2 protein [Flavobacterium piscis]|uniref:Glycosyltransferase involved in cell wall biosynthesis n=1 Tax=Flavobacterium piscis TaxID=1114874 RepID=A0ABU1Y3Z8_9FLAO|nr:glycosyltransferase family 2 protein [Flavobacterium piscis]MDR7208956.1 glycosyltransferase involved in cell wall biosynthesis [Flavobacterium piscis]